jgi:hypothetical protein
MTEKTVLRCSAFHAMGAGVRVAVVDSGVHAAHPHVQGISGGIGVDRDGRVHDDWLDRLGHGTAVTAVIREKAPEAEIVAVKVFDGELATTGAALAAAVEWAIADGAQLINLSLGTTNDAHEPMLADVIARARRAGAFIVAAAPQPGLRWLPGALPGVIGVEVDWTIARDCLRVEQLADGKLRVAASGFPRPVPGVPPAHNLKGPSFAVANATGVLACALSSGGHLREAISSSLGSESGTAPSS